jgi:hypothetical protein
MKFLDFFALKKACILPNPATTLFDICIQRLQNDLNTREGIRTRELQKEGTYCQPGHGMDKNNRTN